MKKTVSKAFAYRLLHPKLTVLVTSASKDGKVNIATFAWCMPTSFSPPMIAVSIAPERYTYKLVKETGDFGVNIPDWSLLEKVFACGRESGEEVDKIAKYGFKLMKSRKIKAPLIEDCVANLECVVRAELKTGDHVLFVGEVVEAYVNEDLFEKAWNLSKVKLIYHVGGNRFTTIYPEITTV
ncbi:MAG: flavin reductase family protein [Thermoprotei archaeon]|nr:MAG: flavin reductase family protein [Thermoprotei archaeon]RLF00969.1 MAG: flavin reductase family protein [Thermoprotei archaeon]HDI74487.1 flavin reductase family protein [Thermoprotei archaeon]